MENNISDHNLSKVQSNIAKGNIYLDSYPIQVHFLMIDKCNVKCIMCGGDYFKSKSGRMITLGKFKTMATNLKLENAKAIVLAGAGDPLLNKDLVSITQFVQKAYPHIYTTITTNGLALSATLSGLLIESGVSTVNVSINSATRATYKRIMQVDGFDAVCKNAKAFAEQRSKSGKPIVLQFSAAINLLNIEELPRLVELGKRIGINSINLFYTRFYPERMRHMNIDNPANRLENDASLFFHQRLSDEMVLKAKMLAQQYGIDFTHEPLFGEHAAACTCMWPMIQLMVGFDGEIYPCGGSEIHFREKVEKGIYNFGNILQNPVDAFWNGEFYRALRISSRQGNVHLVPECHCCANTISPNDMRSHIMQWDEVETDGGHELTSTDPGTKPLLATTEPPLVSVIVPTFNRPDQLVAALKSVLAQTYKNIEIVVVNDCGIDAEHIVSSLNENNSITYVKHRKNKGLAAARNTGIKVAQGKYIAYLDDDDLFYPHHVETLVSFLETGEYKIAYTDAYRAHQEKKNGEYVVTKRDVPYSFDFDYNRILTTNFVPVLCCMHDRSCVEAAGFFDESLKRLEDWDMWIRVSRKFKFAHIKKLTCEFAWRTDGTTMTSGQIHEFVEARRMIHAKHIGAYQPSVPVPKFSVALKSSLTSIIILTFNQSEYTKQCVKSIQKHTPEPHEIIFVDNGSTDGTVKWLKALIQENQNYKLIENKQNLGFAKGCNQGIEASRGEYILLLNNDVVVSEGWLSGLLECLNHASAAGIVGPMTNNISGPQQIFSDEYRSVDDLNRYAAEFRKQYRHRRIQLRRIVGFCMLFKRALAEQIGMLDENFGTGNFEDDDFCLRAALAGYNNYIAGDVFIHHFGSRSFVGNKIDYKTAMFGNRKIIEKKWRLSAASPEGKKLAVLKATELSDDLYQKGRIDQAIEALIDCLKVAPEAKEIYYSLARIFTETKRFSEAWEVVGTIPDAAKNGLKGLECAGYTKEGLGLDDEAAAYADRILSQNENYPAALNLKGVLAYKNGEKEKASDHFKMATDNDPGYGEVYTNLGVLYWSIDKKDEALMHLRKGFVLSPTVPDVSSLYYSFASSVGAYDDLEADFREASRSYPANKNIAFLYIDTLIQQDKLPSAMIEIENALSMFDLDEETMNAALAVRKKIGPLQIEEAVKKRALSLCMIVKNEEKHLAKCLRSVRDVVDEMIVVDTGSTDKTREIATVFGAKLFDLPWTGDFSEARNHSLARATGDWILVLDADEVISVLDHERLLKTIDIGNKRPVAFDMCTRNYLEKSGSTGWIENDGVYQQEEKGVGWYGSNKVRLFRNNSMVRFENPVHELLEASLHKAGIPIETSTIPIHHYGRFDHDKFLAKGRDYYLLGRKKLKERGGSDYVALRELAVQAGELSMSEEAIDLWRQALAVRPDDVDSLFNLGYHYMQIGKYTQALHAAKRAVELSPETKDAVLNYALCELLMGNALKAKDLLERFGSSEGENPTMMAVLGASYLISGNNDAGMSIFKKLAKKQISSAAYMNGILEKLIANGQIEYANQLIDGAVSNDIADRETLRLRDNLYN